MRNMKWMVVVALGVAAAAGAAEPVNEMCPVGKEPITTTGGVVEYKGRPVGLCCPGCGEVFLSWEEARKDEFVRLAAAGMEPGRRGVDADEGPEAPAATDGASAMEAQRMHYPIDTCIVAGGKLGSMGEPVDHVHEGRLVRFCCAMCEPTFKRDPQKFLDQLDERIIEAQRAGYPLETCVVSGEPLGSMGDPAEHIHQNRLVRFCCPPCAGAFADDPERYMAKLDAAYAEAQRDDYPLETCVVSGAALGSMGEPVEVVAGTRLVRFCCAACLPRFRAEPGRYLEKINAASRDEGGVDIEVDQTGAMREVLREGRTEARIALRDAAARPNVYAVGALAGLEGEVTIFDGAVWTTRVADDRPAPSGPGAKPEDRATLLTSAVVESWRDVPLQRRASGAALEDAVRQAAEAAGIDASAPFPFLLEGRAEALDMHVINGFCPESADPSSLDAEPWRWSSEGSTPVRVIGFYAEDAAGVMTHHGSRVHAHALVEIDGRTITGHVDRIVAPAGMALRLPGGPARRR